MAPHFTLQGSPARPLVGDRPLQPSGEIGDPSHVELHRTEVIADGIDLRVSCTCGFLSAAYVSVTPDRLVCPVEDIQASSQERRRRMLSSAAGLSVLR